jgi:MFS family permease
LLFAPLSEIPAIGCNPRYVYTYTVFVALSAVTALMNNFAGLLVLRFLLGFFGAPALTNAGASYVDFFGGRQMPYVKPWEINALYSAVSFRTLYIVLVYGMYYSFFESLPLVYCDIHGFSLGQLGMTFLAVFIGLILRVVIYCAYFYYVRDPKMAKMASVPSEAHL